MWYVGLVCSSLLSPRVAGHLVVADCSLWTIMSIPNVPKIKDLRSRCSEMDQFLEEQTVELEKTIQSGQTDRDFLCFGHGGVDP